MKYDLKEICANCGCTYGAHHGGVTPWPRDYCPGHEGRMDWENGPGTVFKPSGEYREGGHMTIYQELKAAGVEITSHESDLYARVTPASQKIVKNYEHRENVTTFWDREDTPWFDIPLAFDPYWEDRVRKDQMTKEDI